MCISCQNSSLLRNYHTGISLVRCYKEARASFFLRSSSVQGCFAIKGCSGSIRKTQHQQTHQPALKTREEWNGMEELKIGLVFIVQSIR